MSITDYNIINNLCMDELRWLKEEYSDMCSKGDVIINNILDLKIKGQHIEFEYINANSIYVQYIINSLQSYCNGNNPDPYWAD